MNPRTLLILTILVAALGAFIFFVEKDTLSTDERVTREKKVLVIEEDEVEAVEIAWDDQKVRLERRTPDAEQKEGEGDEDSAEPEPEWHLAAPFEARADESGVDGLLSSLGSLEKERTLEDVDRSELGFDEPRGTVTLVTAKGDTTLEIGLEVPASSDMLLAVTGRDEVYQVSNSIWTDLTKDPGDWRDKRLFTAGRSEIDRLTLASGDSRVLLARRGDDFWLESPLTDLADESLVNGLLSEVTGLKVETFLDEPDATPADLGVEPAAGVLEVVLAGREEPFRVELGSSKDAGDDSAEGAKILYARAGSQLVEIKTRLLESFGKTPREWRSRDWTPIQVYRVDSARFDDSDGPLEVVREDSDWKRGEDRVAYSTVSDVLYAVADAKGDEILEPEEAEDRGYALGAPVLRVILETEDGSQSLALHPAVEGFAAATREGRDAVLLIASETADEIVTKVRELREAEPLPAEDEEEGEEIGEEGEK